MNFKDFVKAFLIHTCLYTTVLFSAAMLFVLIGGMTSFATASYFLILAFCAFFALANVIFAKTKLSIWWRSVIHAVLTLGGFYLCIYGRYADIGMNSDALTLFSVLFTLLYAASFGTFLTIRHLRLRKKEKQTYYQSVYNTQKDQKRR
ncbi:MAG: hypothetical protein IJW70_06210 [Clostridia bacterium]|nr:hypothetical protein [Clostridia bacterium]